MNKILGLYLNNGELVFDISSCNYAQIELVGSHAKKYNSCILVDKNSLPLIIPFRWYLGKDGYPSTYGTWDKQIKYKRPYKLHKMLFPQMLKGIVIDHINRNKLDNRLANLRPCTQKQNSYNTSKRNGKYKGVVKHKNGLFSAKITKDGKTYSIDKIRTEKEAAKIYDIMGEELFGIFCGKNFN